MRTRCLAEECTRLLSPSTAGGSPCRRVTERGRQDDGVEISVPWPSCKIVTRCLWWFAAYLCKGPPFPWARAGLRLRAAGSPDLHLDHHGLLAKRRSLALSWAASTNDPHKCKLFPGPGHGRSS